VVAFGRKLGEEIPPEEGDVGEGMGESNEAPSTVRTVP